MSEPYRTTESTQLITNRGIIEIISLISGGSAASTVSIFDSHVNSGTHGRRLWDLAAVTGDSETTPILNIPFKWGVYASLSGANSQTIVTVR